MEDWKFIRLLNCSFARYFTSIERIFTKHSWTWIIESATNSWLWFTLGTMNFWRELISTGFFEWKSFLDIENLTKRRSNDIPWSLMSNSGRLLSSINNSRAFMCTTPATKTWKKKSFQLFTSGFASPWTVQTSCASWPAVKHTKSV